MTDRMVKALEASSSASSLVFFCRYSVKTGTKEMVREPSPKRRLSILGIRKATQKASVIQLAPNRAAITMSRTTPKTRLTMVAAPTIPAALATLAFSDFSVGLTISRFFSSRI